MSNFDDERQNVENQTYDRFKETGKIGAKVTYKAGKKITTKAGKKLLARKGYKKFTGGMIKGAKAIGKGIMSLGKAFIAAIKALIAIFLSWGWIILLILAVAVLFWVLMPALKQYTFNSTNQEPGVFETNIKLSDENKSYDNYFKYYSDKSLTQNKVAIFYNDIDYRKTGRELFDELNEKKYILGPRKPTQIVPPGNFSSGGSGSDGNTGSEIPGEIIIGEGATKALLEEAQKHLGKKYVWGGKGPNNFDCSGFVYYCMNQIGANMQYHTSSALRKELQYKDRSELQPGDFVFYHKGTSSTTYHTVDHVAIYMGKINGEDKIIHSSYSEGKVCIQKLPSNSAKRVYTYGRWPGLPLPGEDENSKEENSNSTEKSKSITLFDNIFSKTKTSNNSENTSLKKPNDITVVIDAGHGGSKAGAVNKTTGTKEKDINLIVAKLLETKLKQEGYKTIMTRTEDKHVSISDRYKLSNQYGDVFISIHCNAVNSTSARGGLTVYWKDKDFAEYIQDGFIKAVNIKDRGAKHVNELGREEGIGVLQNAKKPAALVELAFISNPDDEKLLTSSDFQQKAANGIAQGLNNYVNKVPIDTSSKDPNYNGGSSSSNSYEIIKTLKEMEGFISEETIDKLQQYWESKANPTLGWDWDTDELRKELNELINYSYDIEKFEKIDTNKLTHLKQEQLSTKVELKDKYNRERYFNITPELLYSLNSSLYKEEFMHTNALIKPVKTKMVNGKLQLDANAFILDNDKELNSLAKDEAWYKDEKDLSNEFKESISSYLKTDEEKEEEKENNDKKNKKEEDFNKYGLGTVFVYRPVITFNIERGIEINQTAQSSESTTTNEEGETVTSITLNSKPSGRVIDNIDCKIEYVLDRAITFSGEYVFKYEQVVNVLEEKNVEQILSEDGITTGNLIQSKKYEITEVPSDIVLQNKGRTYLSNYLGNFKASIPTDIMNGFNERRLIESFLEYTSLDNSKKIESSQNSNSGEIGDTGGMSAVEFWRPLCKEVGEKYGVDENILLMLIENESGGNIHIKPSYTPYKGLAAMRADSKFHDYVIVNLPKDSPYRSYTVKDVFPNGGSCSGKSCNLNDEEHQRVARFHIEYLAARVSSSMSYCLVKYKSINPSVDSVSVDLIQEAIYFGTNAYNTGDGGQSRMYKKYGLSLYEEPGTFYTEMHYKHCSDLAPKYNAKYYEKNIVKFPKYSQYPFKNAAEQGNYDPSKWYNPHKGSSGGNNGQTDNNNNQNNLGNEDSNVKYSNAKAEKYDAYEEHGWFGDMSRFSTSLSSDKVELTLALGTAMKEEISMTDVKNGNYSYWDDDYIKNNFVSGLPKGRNFKDYDRGKNSNKDWKKILDTVSYIRQNIGARSIGKMNILNTSAVIGHAYEVNAKLKVPKTPLAIKQKIKLKVNGEEEIQLGDILLLETKVLDEDLEGIHPYVIETAIFVGEEDGENKYAIVNNNRLVLMDINTIQELYNIDSIVRPISNEYSGDEDSSSNSNQISTTGGEWAWPTTTNVISSDFGPRNIKKGSNPHKGIDIVDVLDGNHLEGTNVPILASKDGVVHHVSHTDSSNAGVYVVLEHSDGTLSEYMHLKPGSTSHVKVGQSFKQGEQVGIMGTTGTSSGIHLHFSIKSLDKDKFKDIEATYPGSVLQGGGNYYFVDPELVLSKPANLKVYRGGGKWNLSYQN